MFTSKAVLPLPSSLLQFHSVVKVRQLEIENWRYKNEVLIIHESHSRLFTTLLH